MAKYKDLCERYKKKKNDTLIDTIASGLALSDEVAVDLNLFESLGVYEEVLDNVLDVLPFAIIAVTEGQKVIFGKKKASHAINDAAYRSIKSGTAIAIGAGVASIAGAPVGIPAAISTRILFDRYKSKTLLAKRVKTRVEAISFLKRKWRPELEPPKEAVSGNEMALSN